MSLLLTYTLAVRSEFALDPEILRRIAAFSSANGGVLDSALAVRTDLPAEVFDALVEVRDVNVRVAVLSHPDLDPVVRTRLLADESRSKVLTLLAQDSCTAPAVLAELAGHDSVAVPMAVLGNVGAPVEARRQAFFNAVNRAVKLNQKQKDAVAALVAADVAFESEYVLGVDAVPYDHDLHYYDQHVAAQVEVFAMFADRVNLSSAAVAHLVRGHLVRLIDAALDHNVSSHGPYDLYRLFERYAVMANLDGPTAALLEEYSRRSAAAWPIHYGSNKSTIAQVRAVADSAYRELLSTAVESTNQVELAGVVATDGVGPLVLKAVYGNVAASGETTLLAAKAIRACSTSGFETVPPFPEHRWHQDDVVRTLWFGGVHAALSSWVPTIEQHDLLVELVGYSGEHFVSSLVRANLVYAAFFACPDVVDDAVLDVFPVDALQYARHKHSETTIQARVTARLVELVIAAGLGDDIVAVAVESCSSELSVAEVVELARTLAA